MQNLNTNIAQFLFMNALKLILAYVHASAFIKQELTVIVVMTRHVCSKCN